MRRFGTQGPVNSKDNYVVARREELSDFIARVKEGRYYRSVLHHDRLVKPRSSKMHSRHLPSKEQTTFLYNSTSRNTKT